MFYKQKHNSTEKLSDAERADEIARLEEEREGVDTEIERLLADYARLTRNYTVKRGARRIGDSPKDRSFWNLPDRRKKK